MDDDTTLKAAIKSLAKAHAHIRTDDILTADELVQAALVFGVLPLNYDAYCTVKDAVCPTAQKLLTSTLFAKVSNDQYSKIKLVHTFK